MKDGETGNLPAAPEASRAASAGDYLALTKPGLMTMSVCTAAGGAYLGSGGHPPPLTALHLIIGTMLVGAGAGALNQWIERDTDALMNRTAHRPLPSGVISPSLGLTIGLCCALAGVGYLFLATTPAAGILAIVTLCVYLLLYTPLKKVTHLSTAVGGIPGALPPVIGWAAVGRGFSLEAYLLFLFLFLWQMPHFLALAWMYRSDYARGGFRFLPQFDVSGRVTGRLMMLYTTALFPVTLSLVLVGLMGWVFLAGAAIAGVGFFVIASRFVREISDERARDIFLASLAYLSVLLCLMLIDRLALG